MQSDNYTPLVTNSVNYPIVYTPKKIRSFYSLLSALTLIAGMVIYLLFRDVNNMVLFSWIPKPDFFGTILIPLKSSIFTNILRYNLPDMLWFISTILFLRFIWFNKLKEQRVYIICFYGIALIFELCDSCKLLYNIYGIGAFVES